MFVVQSFSFRILRGSCGRFRLILRTKAVDKATSLTLVVHSVEWFSDVSVATTSREHVLFFFV